MKKKMMAIFVCMLLIVIVHQTAVSVQAGDEENPEIEDTTGDARPYLDIEKAWFYEDPEKPQYLYTTIKIRQPSDIVPKQHLVVSWEMNGKHYASMLAIGYNFDQWFYYAAYAGKTHFDGRYNETIINGEFNKEEGTITCEIPKSAVGNPQPGDVLTNTWSQCFQRFGFWGRLGFSPIFRYLLFNEILKFWQVEDRAPDEPGEYGKEYIVKY